MTGAGAATRAGEQGMPRADVAALVRRLVAVDATNPSLVPGASGEAAIAAEIAAELGAIGLEVEVQEAAPGRPNIVGTLTGRSPGRSLMFRGHIDTVGVAGMARPFDPVETGGRVYGRGSQDMKGGVAAMIGAAAYFRSQVAPHAVGDLTLDVYANLPLEGTT